MFGKVIVKLYNWYVKRLQKKQKDTKEDIQKQREIEFYTNLRGVYSFVQWLNRQFVNRHDRKTFWKNVSEGTTGVDKVIQQLLTNYKKQQEDKNSNAK